MNSRLRLVALLLLPCLGMALAGCVPQAQSDEEKESHFLAGKSRVSTMDFPGAIEAFEKALDANPHSAAAHFELGCLYDQKDPNPASAIYHYEAFLKLRPDAGNADVVKQRIMTCKQELARTVSLGPVTEKFQREFEQLTEDKKKLLEENKSLREQLDQLRVMLSRVPGSNTLTGVPPAARTAGPGAVAAKTSGTGPVIPGAISLPAQGADARNTSSTSTSPTRSHTVKSGDTLSAIARRYGVKLDSLTSLNPKVDPRRLQVGQVLAVP